MFTLYVARGGDRNFPTRRLTLPTRRLKYGFQGIVSAKNLRQTSSSPSDGGLACSDKGAIAPSSPPLAPPLPVAQPRRRIPFHLRKQVTKELKKLEQDGIIEDVEGPTPWISPLSCSSEAKWNSVTLCRIKQFNEKGT